LDCFRALSKIELFSYKHLRFGKLKKFLNLGANCESRVRSEEETGALESQFSTILTQMAFAAKTIALEFGRAALVGKLGLVGKQNFTGDAQKKLDIFTNEVIKDAFVSNGLVAAMVSEEMEDIYHIVCTPKSRYILCIDPLDGSSNADINGAVGTIFHLLNTFSRYSSLIVCCVLQIQFLLRISISIVAKTGNGLFLVLQTYPIP